MVIVYQIIEVLKFWNSILHRINQMKCNVYSNIFKSINKKTRLISNPTALVINWIFWMISFYEEPKFNMLF
jgi:hypothetical protein